MVKAETDPTAEVPEPDLPPGYRMTELGPLPEEWGVVRIGALASLGVLLIQNGYAQGGHNTAGEGIPHLRPFNVTCDGRLDLSQIKYVPPPPTDSPYWLRPGDVLFNNTNSEELVGKTAHFSKNGGFVLSNHMTVLRVLNEARIDSYWLAQQLLHLWQTGLFARLCRRYVNQASVSLERLRGISLPLPPLAEQRAIAHVLRTVQRAREATEAVIAAARELKRSLMRHLFTYGPVPVMDADHVPLKETEIGPVPEQWEVVRLGDVADLKLGRTPSRDNPEYWSKGEVPWVSVADLNFGWVRGTKEHVSARADGEVFHGERVPPGTVLLSFKLSVGKVGILAMPAVHNEAIVSLHLMGGRVDRNFLFFKLQTIDYSAHLDAYVKGKTLNKRKLQALPLSLPPLAEQRAVGQMLRAVDDKIAAMENRLQAVDALFRSLLHHLMTGKVRVTDLESLPPQEEA